MGIKIDQFDIPVCNSFKAKIFNDQLCYQVDPNKYKKYFDSKKLGISFFVDTNQDRQFPNAAAQNSFNVYLDTLGV